MVLGPEGIDAKEHFFRRMQKGLSASNQIRVSGIGFLKANVVSTLVRTILMPQLEYGLAVVKPTKKILKGLAKIVSQTGKKILGVSVSTSTDMVSWYLGIP